MQSLKGPGTSKIRRRGKYQRIQIETNKEAIEYYIRVSKGGLMLNGKLELGRYIDPTKPMVALTFDDGPSPEATPEILRILKENDAEGTFFVLGVQAELYPDILKQIQEEGNEIGNHSYSHLDYTRLVEPELEFQILTTQELVRMATGKAPVLLRPPYGFVNEAVRNIDMPIILWSIDSLDWQDQNPEIIYNRVLNNIKDGDIILMHDTYKSSAEAALRIIPELKRRGYQLVTVSELARTRGIALEPGNVYGNLYP